MGVGSNLELFLKWMSIKEKQGCNCKHLASELDRLGPEWCEQHFDAIISELAIRAKEYSYPWNRTAARMLLRASIILAK